MKTNQALRCAGFHSIVGSGILNLPREKSYSLWKDKASKILYLLIDSIMLLPRDLSG